MGQGLGMFAWRMLGFRIKVSLPILFGGSQGARDSLYQYHKGS